jgi:hypothetical protein
VNCNAKGKPGGELPWSDALYRDGPTPTCAEREAYFAGHGFTYGQIERPFRFGDYCPDKFLYFTMLRDPVSAARSIINYIPVKGGHEKLLQCVEAKRPDCGDHLGSNWFARTQNWFDNYMNRYILGPEVFELPTGEVNDTHAQAAIKVLDQFDLVVTLEGFATGSTQKSLNALLGWSLALEKPSSVLPSQPSSVHPSPEKYNFTAEQETRLRALIKHDYTVYNHFNQKQHNTRK